MLQVFKHANAFQLHEPWKLFSLKLSSDFLLALLQRPHTDSCLVPSSPPIWPANSRQISLPQLQCPQLSKTTRLAWFPFLNCGPDTDFGQKARGIIAFMSFVSYLSGPILPVTQHLEAVFSCILFSFLFFYGGKTNMLPVIPSQPEIKVLPSFVVWATRFWFCYQIAVCFYVGIQPQHPSPFQPPILTFSRKQELTTTEMKNVTSLGWKNVVILCEDKAQQWTRSVLVIRRK